MPTFLYVRNARRAGLARRLARRLGIRCVDANTAPRADRGIRLINWGNSTPPTWSNRKEFTWLANTPDHIATASHKIRSLTALSNGGVPTLDYTTNRETALEWFRNGARVYARRLVQGHSGEGLVFLDPQSNTEQDVVQAPLYTKDFRTPFKEYRVHVVFGNVIDMTQKRRLSAEEILARGLALPDERTRLQVRTYGNGWIFSRGNLWDHPSIRELALNTARTIDDMPMVCVDIAVEWRRREDIPTRPAVIETNTAPAIRSDTLLDAYVNALRPHI